MIAIISPAKTLDIKGYKPELPFLEPQFGKEAYKLIQSLKKIKKAELMQMMDISEKIADLNIDRYKRFSKVNNPENSKQAILSFKGDVYQGLQAESFSEEDLMFAHAHIRILSGLYGILRPMDLMQEYRLEMGTDLKTAPANNLYEFWGDKITKSINKEIAQHKNRIVVNLASQEYWKVIHSDKLKAKVLNIEFHEERNGKLVFVSFNAKRARGMMCRYIVKNRVDDPESLKAFDSDGYYFAEHISSPSQYRFIR